MRAHLIKLASFAGINKAIGFSLMARGWQIFTGPLTLLIVAHQFSLAQQGFYYTFNSVLGLQVLFELGLAFVITQFTSHEFAKLSWGHAGKVLGDIDAVDRLHEIIKRSVMWYCCIALLIMIFIFPAGLYFFNTRDVGGLAIAWKGPWLALVLAASAYLPIIPILAVIEGSGRVAEVNRLRLMQGVCSSVLTWLAILSGAGLYAASVTFVVSLMFSYGWILLMYRELLSSIKFQSKRTKTSKFSWKSEIWPMQWRIAVSWMSGYFIFQLFTPILFYYHGPVVAGRMGMSLVIVNMINTVALVWLQANMPSMAQCVVRSEWKVLDRLFTKVFWQSSFVSMFGSALLIAMLWVFSSHQLIHRLLPINEMIYLLVAFFLSHVIGALAFYLRIHKREPFMFLSVLGALLVGIALWFFGSYYGSKEMAFSLMMINLLYGLPSAAWLWWRLRKKWHSQIDSFYE